MIKKLLMVFVAFLLIIPIALASQDYNRTGDKDFLFQLDTGFFNENLDLGKLTQVTRSLSNAKHHPFVNDMDKDGQQEIIVLDGNVVRIMRYTGTAISQIETATLTSDQEMSNAIIFDIDGNGFNDYIVAETSSEFIWMVEFNGTDTNTNFLNLSSISHTPTADMMLQCKGTDDCLLVYSTNNTGGGASGRVYGIPFDSTSLGTETLIDTTSWTNSKFCFPLIRNFVVADYDSDSTDEYVISAYDNSPSAKLIAYIWAVRVDSLASTTVELTITNSESDIVVGLTCDAQDDRDITPPLVFDIDTGGDPEIIIGIEQDSNDFKIEAFDSAGTNIDEYPSIANGDGVIISNVFAGNYVADSDSVENEVCVIGYNPTNNNTEMICANEGAFIETIAYDIENLDVISQSSGDEFWNTMAHSVQHSSVTKDGENLNEILTSYGVFRLDFTPAGCFDTFGDCGLELIWDNPRDDASVIQVDYEKEGLDDIILLQKNNIWYIDDGFTNSPGEIDSYEINPCIDSVWKVNTTVNVLIEVTDIDNDLVSARSILYQGDSNEQDSGYSINASRGTTFTFAFVANETIGIGNLRMLGRDVENLNSPNQIDVTFSVATNGVEFGDCVTRVDVPTSAENVTVAEEEAVASLTTDAKDNSISSGLDTVIGLTGLAGTTFWLFLMLAFSIGIFFRGSQIGWSGNSILGAIAIVNVLFIVIGARVGVISTGMVVILVVTGVVIIGVFLGRFLTGLRASSD